ncbi:hypothetical protein [Nocardia sp. NPDC006630]|uniref:hypothetical protein n=1 Tax=Nocardia sp. NPDC006630 TaxID=3157181 RepID=UPI0033AE14D8
MFRKAVVVVTASVAMMGVGGAVANAFTVQDEIKFFLLQDQQASPDYKQLDVDLGRLDCQILDLGGPGTKAELMALDREYPGTSTGLLGVTETEIDTLVYCPQHILSS